jgi:hypothetical protein
VRLHATVRLHELIGLRCLRNGVCVACVPLRVCPNKHTTAMGVRSWETHIFA